MAEKSSPATRQTDGKNLVWLGEIERKLVKLSMPTFTYRSYSSLFYGAHSILDWEGGGQGTPIFGDQLLCQTVGIRGGGDWGGPLGAITAGITPISEKPVRLSHSTLG